MPTERSGGESLSKRELLSYPRSPSRVDIKPCLGRYDGKVTDHNFGSLIRTNAEEEYSESNTIFGALREPVSGSATEIVGSDESAVFSFRGECRMENYRSLMALDH